MVIGILAVLLTIAVYIAAKNIHKRCTNPFTIPIMLSTMFIILFLLMFNLPYEMYMAGGDWISKLLGPAVVALAYPLYLHRRTLMKMAGPIMIGTASGSFTGVVTGFFLAKQAGFEDAILYAMTTKSVTIPVAMAVTETLGGDHIICCCICNDCRYWRRTDV